MAFLILGLLFAQQVVIWSLTYRCAYFRQKMLNRASDAKLRGELEQANKFWSFLK